MGRAAHGSLEGLVQDFAQGGVGVDLKRNGASDGGGIWIDVHSEVISSREYAAVQVVAHPNVEGSVTHKTLWDACPTHLWRVTCSSKTTLDARCDTTVHIKVGRGGRATNGHFAADSRHDNHVAHSDYLGSTQRCDEVQDTTVARRKSNRRRS